MSFLLETKSFNPQKLPLEETLFHTANGYLGVRGNFEEGQPEGTNGVRGTYINAFYDTHAIHHPEKLFSFPETGEKIINVTDVQTIRVRVDGELINLNTSNTKEFSRCLDMKKGYTCRAFIWTGSTGKRVRIESCRLASFTRMEVFAIQYTVTALDPAHIVIESAIQGDVSNFFDPSDPRVSGSAFKSLQVTDISTRDNTVEIESRTKATNLTLWVQVDHVISGSGDVIGKPDVSQTGTSAQLTWNKACAADESMTLEKTAVFCDSMRHPAGRRQLETIRNDLRPLTFSNLCAEQEKYLQSFWDESGIEIDGDDHILLGLRFNLYNLLQSAARDPRANIPAKGLSGEGYEGHYFWDTEIYMLPFFLYTRPHLARNLLQYRHTTLPAARQHAHELGHSRGAAYPWRTITGRECSAYYPSGSAQYHINADIAYSVFRYWEATGDMDFMTQYGAEILFETARIWMETGNFSDGKFHINTVTGPDEYTCMVNNNYYTNRMAQLNLRNAVKIYRLMDKTASTDLVELCAKISLDRHEPENWEKAASDMVIPYDSTRDMNPQDDSFFQKPVWDLQNTPADKHPLLLHYHHMTLSRFQVCKQADTVLAYILLNPDEKPSTIQNSYEYYERVTTHDSSLSYAAFAIMAARLKDPEKAYRYFEKTAALDLDDSHKNTKDGIHAANMGGTWLATVWGFGGFSPMGDVPGFAPHLPGQWKSLGYRITYRGSVIMVKALHDRVDFRLLSGERTDIIVYNKTYRLETELSIQVPEKSL